MSGSSTTTIREMTEGDAEQVAALSGELGYPSTPAQIRARLLAIEGHPDARVFVASELGGRVRGWVHVFGHRQLESDGAAGVGGLVVEAGSRGHGIGRALMDVAESWARERGYQRVTIPSNVIRDQAHRFYQRLGYTIVKTQHKLEKPIL